MTSHFGVHHSEPGSRTLLPLILAACVLLLCIWMLWRRSTKPVVPSLPTPTRCSHWVALRGAIQHPKVICWQPPRSRLALVHLRRWRQHVQQAGPTCTLPGHLPIPDPGHQLVLTAGNKLCRAEVLLMRGSTRIGLGLRLLLNRETVQDLAAIPGLSRRLAQRIVAHRKQHGPFRSLEELVRIKGIGPKTVQRLKPYLLIEKKTSPAPPGP